MSTSVIILVVVIALIVIWVIGIYNTLVHLRNNRESAFANIDVQLQQRHDLVPQLVATVKGYAQHEKTLLESVTAARTAAMAATTINDKIQAENALTQALSGLKVAVEAYPDLKANQNFLELQAQLEGTENRIAVERKNFNDAAKKYNTYIRKFPQSLLSGAFGFDKKPYFEAEEGSQKAPTVQF